MAKIAFWEKQMADFAPAFYYAQVGRYYLIVFPFAGKSRERETDGERARKPRTLFVLRSNDSNCNRFGLTQRNCLLFCSVHGAR